MARNRDCVSSTDGRNCINNVCDHCATFGTVKKAFSFCHTCGLQLCVSCDGLHTRIAPKHKLTFDGQVSEYKDRNSFTQCPLHRKENVVFYCEEHNAVICQICKETDHIECFVKNVLEAFTEMTVSGEFSDVFTKLHNLKAKADKILRENQLKLEVVFRDVKDIRNKIELLRKEITKILNSYLEQISFQEQSFINSLSIAIQTSTHFKDELKTQIKSMKAAKSNQCQRLVLLSESEKMYTVYEGILNQISNNNIIYDISIKHDDRLSVLIGEIYNIDNKQDTEVEESESIPDEKISVDTSHQPMIKSFLKIKSCFALKETDVRVRNDENAPYITGCRWMLEDQIFLCDNNNRNIKILDTDLNVILTALCMHAPFDVDRINETSGVVTLPEAKSLQFITIKPGFKFMHTKCLNLRCFGVAVHESNIFVCINDTQQSVKCIKILTLDGNNLSYISHQGPGGPRFLCLNGAGTRVYYTGGSGNKMFVNCVTKDGHAIFSVSNIKLDYPRTVLKDEDDNVIVCDDKGNCIQVISSDGIFGNVLLSEKDNTIQPKSICFNKAMDILAVAYWKENENNSRLKLYKIEYKKHIR